MPHHLGKPFGWSLLIEAEIEGAGREPGKGLRLPWRFHVLG